MGYENVGSNLGSLQSILSAAGGVMDQAGEAASDSATNQALEEKARLAELDAKEAARQEREEAAQQAQEIRADKQRRKARARAVWGMSGMAMSGSPLLIMDAMDSSAENEAQLKIDQGEDKAQGALSYGNSTAAAYRNQAASSSATGVNPFALGSSIIGLGKQIYDLPLFGGQ